MIPLLNLPKILGSIRRAFTWTSTSFLPISDAALSAVPGGIAPVANMTGEGTTGSSSNEPRHNVSPAFANMDSFKARPWYDLGHKAGFKMRGNRNGFVDAVKTILTEHADLCSAIVDELREKTAELRKRIFLDAANAKLYDLDKIELDAVQKQLEEYEKQSSMDITDDKLKCQAAITNFRMGFNDGVAVYEMVDEIITSPKIA